MKPILALWFFLAANLISAAYSPIEDCDETFNYWEPTHYLSHGYGLQTWEYSPQYAIRSWLYVAIHAIIGSFRHLLPFPAKVRLLTVLPRPLANWLPLKVAEFYYIRYILAFSCAVAQTQLFRVITITLNPRIAMFFLISMIFSPGMFRASTAYLPSSFAMYTTMFGMAAFINWRGGLKTAQGIFWFAVGGILGWPFSVALAVPFLVEEVIFAAVSSRDALPDTVMRFIRGIVASLLVLAAEFGVSSYFYDKTALVPLNIVLYNVFAGEGRGPNIYGTEPWHFYIRNLLLNFNIWFILALASLPLFLLMKLFSRDRQSATTGLRTVIFMSPFYLWLAIFTLQPHKEERFMYPAYPALCLNAAMALHIVLAHLGHSDPRTLIGKIPASLKLLLVVSTMLGAINLGLSRMYGMYEAYHAPMSIYSKLNAPQFENMTAPGRTVCYGKDWYRFPTSYFLPQGMKAKFIKSDFDGLLPGEFAEASKGSGFGWRAGTWMMPSGMNDKNEEDMGKYTDVRNCNFLVDTYFPGNDPTEHEKAFMLDTVNWEIVKCEPFLDVQRTHVLARTLWLPVDVPGYRRAYGQHCLFKRMERSPDLLSLKERVEDFDRANAREPSRQVEEFERLKEEKRDAVEDVKGFA